jgi:hypothetical protein
MALSRLALKGSAQEIRSGGGKNAEAIAQALEHIANTLNSVIGHLDELQASQPEPVMMLADTPLTVTTEPFSYVDPGGVVRSKLVVTGVTLNTVNRIFAGGRLKRIL